MITKESLLSSLSALDNSRILIAGDIMLDEYIIGDVNRISPEAPVPVLEVAKEAFHLGGAGNVAQNIVSYGCEVELLTAVGKDRTASRLHKLLGEYQIKFHFITDSSRPTTRKTRILARNQQVIRIDKESANPLSVSLMNEIEEMYCQCIKRHTTLIVSDYGKGFVTREILDLIRASKGKDEQEVKVLIDPKTKNFALYSSAYLLTPNAKEASEGAGLPSFTSQKDILRAGQKIQSDLQLKNLLITLGADGMVLFNESGEVWHLPTSARNVYDVTGAGDTVIATIGACASAGIDLLSACAIANYAAGIVVGQVGTASVRLEQLKQTIGELPLPTISRWA